MVSIIPTPKRQPYSFAFQVKVYNKKHIEVMLLTQEQKRDMLLLSNHDYSFVTLDDGSYLFISIFYAGDTPTKMDFRKAIMQTLYHYSLMVLGTGAKTHANDAI